MLFRAFALYRQNGDICFTHTWARNGPNPDAAGTKVWEWFTDEELVKTHFARALMDSPLPPVILRVSTAKREQPLSALSQFLPSGVDDAPVCGVFSAFTENVLAMTPRERQVAKLLPFHPAKKIARELGVTESTINTLRQRIAERIGRVGPALIAALAELHDVL